MLGPDTGWAGWFHYHHISIIGQTYATVVVGLVRAFNTTYYGIVHSTRNM